MINKKTKKAFKAYENLNFLNSPEARSIRMLSEYEEPLSRFKKLKIDHTIVFFGSARIKSGETAKKDHKIVRDSVKKSKLGKNLIHSAEMDIEMAKYYDATVELSSRLTKWSMTLKHESKFVVCSGGGPGIMEAANKGAMQAGGLSMGLNISLPFEQFPNPFISPELNFEFHYFFMRKFWFAYPAKALIVMPGGFGTLDELMEILTLVQTKKLNKKILIVIFGKEYWNKVINFTMLAEMHMISKKDLSLFKFVETVDEAYDYLTKKLPQSVYGNTVKETKNTTA
ncbi:TIGR00730 family Rossman fold protein [soil metagenome]